ncbi:MULTISPECIES: YafY family protein [unclassified Breznakia]|uniref:helix-turn-helix transcriptional regulator n=1 Tax=unclassified Breznakia TaxID=2623764 RepID=UPI0024055DD7|nr:MULTISPECIES: YafY family protein [unclassified Breznakia]MDF9837040.1 putative DNA-binding transcriptional regulator YafY [Breznakia sp. PFB2-8]MDF9858965.1 putative DNA-binding transcriptional regulator YafY [Breznakia sp. PH5-24]
MKENRYFQMIYLLLEKGKMTAPELAAHFEVSVRTIYRDIDILSSAGIPVYATQGKGGGIFIQDNFVLNKSILSEEEQQQILMALQGTKVMEEENTNQLLSKLSGVFQKQNTNWFEFDFSGWTKTSARKETFQTLQEAIFKRRKVSFQYYNSNGYAIERIVEPLKIVFKSYDWYVYGFCTMRQDYRFFKLIRIKALKMMEDEYERTIPAEIFKRSAEFEMDMIKVKLLFDKSVLVKVYEEFDDEVVKNEDGNLIVHTQMPNNDLLFRYILSYGDKVEVLAPQKIRDIIAKRIEKITEKYKT